MSKKTTKKRPKKTPRVRVTVELSAPLGMKLTRAKSRLVQREARAMFDVWMGRIFIDDHNHIDLRVDRVKVGQDE